MQFLHEVSLLVNPERTDFFLFAFIRHNAEYTFADGLNYVGTGPQPPGLRRFRKAKRPLENHRGPDSRAFASPMHSPRAHRTNHYFPSVLRAVSNHHCSAGKHGVVLIFFSIIQPFLLYAVI